MASRRPTPGSSHAAHGAHAGERDDAPPPQDPGCRENATMARSLVTIDLPAVRRNVTRLRTVAEGAEVWAVVKADAYGHGVTDVAPAALEAGAAVLCVATVGEALAVRSLLPEARILVLGPTQPGDLAPARQARLELAVVADGPLPEGIPLHVKLDTGMGRWGLAELPSPSRDVVGVMSHFASADEDPAFTRAQLERFLAATAGLDGPTRHIANSAGTLAFPEARLDAVRCGIALYGIDPFGEDAVRHGLRPVLRWESEIAVVKLLPPGGSTGYGRRFVADRPTWIGVVPVGYADGFSRDLSGAVVNVGGAPCRVVGTVSMDAVAVELAGALEPGTPVTLVGDGVTLEQHARVAGTIGYELACGVRSAPPRAERRVVR
jgi:alanine racemase